MSELSEAIDLMRREINEMEADSAHEEAAALRVVLAAATRAGESDAVPVAREEILDALRPLAEKWQKSIDRYTRCGSNQHNTMPAHWPVEVTVTVQHCRTAHAALYARPTPAPASEVEELETPPRYFLDDRGFMHPTERGPWVLWKDTIYARPTPAPASAYRQFYEGVKLCMDDTWQCEGCGRAEPWWTESNADFATRKAVAALYARPTPAGDGGAAVYSALGDMLHLATREHTTGQKWDAALQKAGRAMEKYVHLSPTPAPASDEVREMNAPGAVFLLLGQLTCSDDLPPLGSTHDAAPWAEIAKAFCEKHGLTEEPRWPAQPESAPADAGAVSSPD